MMMTGRLRGWAPAQLAALLFGVFWIGNGIAVFASADPAVTTLDGQGTVEAFGAPIAVNGWHGLFHFLTGVAGVVASPWLRSARAYTLLVGAIYFAAALWNLLAGASVFGLIRVDALGSAEHAVEGVVLLLAWLASPPDTRRLGRAPDPIRTQGIR